MLIRTKLPKSASLARRIGYPIVRNYVYFMFGYLPYAPIKRVNKPDLSGPYIWSCSHSNFFCDGMPAGTEGICPTKFLGKSTLFQFPTKNFVEYCGVLPLVRQSDQGGMTASERSAQNRNTFKAAIQAFQQGWPVAIFPEGVSEVNPGLILPLKPGVAKLGFVAEEACNFSLNLRIIPVGVDYHSRTKIGYGMTIRYGKPIYLKDFQKLHEENPTEAVKQLMDVLTQEMIRIFPHFTDEHKQTLGRKLLLAGAVESKYDAAQLFLQKTEDKIFWTNLESKLKEFEEESITLSIPIADWGLRKAWLRLRPAQRLFQRLVVVLGLPLIFVEVVNNSFAEFCLKSLVEFGASDDTEKMSIRFIAAPYVLFAVYAAQFYALKKWLFPQNLGELSGLWLLPYCAAGALLWVFYQHWKKFARHWASIFYFWKADQQELKRVETIHEELSQVLR